MEPNRTNEITLVDERSTSLGTVRMNDTCPSCNCYPRSHDARAAGPRTPRSYYSSQEDTHHPHAIAAAHAHCHHTPKR